MLSVVKMSVIVGTDVNERITFRKLLWNYLRGREGNGPFIAERRASITKERTPATKTEIQLNRGGGGRAVHAVTWRTPRNAKFYAFKYPFIAVSMHRHNRRAGERSFLQARSTFGQLDGTNGILNCERCVITCNANCACLIAPRLGLCSCCDAHPDLVAG